MTRLHINPEIHSRHIVSKSVSILTKELKKRCNEMVELTDCVAEADIRIGIDNSIGKEGYRISEEDGTVFIEGNDEKGVLYGIGKLLHTSTFRDNEFVLSSWRGTSVPQREVRAIYFATHFHNFYHVGPIDAIEEYIETLALWGCNALAVWFDMHHFDGIDDPDAQAMIERLKAMLLAANGVGIGAVFLGLANEGYKNSPEHIRADWTAGHDGYFAAPAGHYRCEVCPGTQEGLDYIARTRGEIMDAFADVTFDHYIIWPYDQGGCTCPTCTPWGANGLMAAAETVASVVRDKAPKTKIILSTWYFDHFIHGEWKAFDRYIRTSKPDWIDFLLADDNADHYPEFILEHGMPGNLPLVSFPEISMYKMSPWGGFGANPMPDHFQSIWDSAKDKLSGGFPYSEGIYEDINKIICLQFFWGNRLAQETVREYVTYECCSDMADEIVKAIQMLENNQLNNWQNETVSPDAFDILLGVEEKMTARARRQWRWRILIRRAQIDRELLKNSGKLTLACKDACQELVEIYHAQNSFVGNAVDLKGVPWNG